MKKLSIPLLSLTAVLLLNCSPSQPQPKGLRTDLMRYSDYVGLNGVKQSLPLNDDLLADARYEVPMVQSEQPLLNWVLDDQSQDAVAFQVLVSSDLIKLKKDQGDLWDSGKINSANASVLYNGLPLQHKKVYYWKVRYWEDQEKVSAYSDPQAFVVAPDSDIEKFSQEPLIATD